MLKGAHDCGVGTLKISLYLNNCDLFSYSVCFQVDGGCDVVLQLDLLETKCHIVNPQHFEDCEIREESERVNARHQVICSSSPFSAVHHINLEPGRIMHRHCCCVVIHEIAN